MAEQYIYHVTTSTGHARKSPKREVNRATLDILRGWVVKLLNGEQMAITDERYSCRVGAHDSKFCEFLISRIDEQMRTADLVRFTVCRHSRQKRKAWEAVGGEGEAPNVPFCAAQLFPANVRPEDLEFLPVFGDFERCLAWAWIEYQEERKNAN